MLFLKLSRDVEGCGGDGVVVEGRTGSGSDVGAAVSGVETVMRKVVRKGEKGIQELKNGRRKKEGTKE